MKKNPLRKSTNLSLKGKPLSQQPVHEFEFRRKKFDCQFPIPVR